MISIPHLSRLAVCISTETLSKQDQINILFSNLKSKVIMFRCLFLAVDEKLFCQLLFLVSTNIVDDFGRFFELHLVLLCIEKTGKTSKSLLSL